MDNTVKPLDRLPDWVFDPYTNRYTKGPCMIATVLDGFVIAHGGVWQPGVYDRLLTAVMAFEAHPFALQAVKDAVGINFISMKDLRPWIKPSLSDVINQFVDYHQKPGNEEWSSLHIVLSDGNVRDSDVEFCIREAKNNCDVTGYDLACLLYRMSKTQRRKIGNVA